MESSLKTIDASLDDQPNIPALTTRGRGLFGVTVDVHDAIDDSYAEYTPRDHHVLGWAMKESRRVNQRRAGEFCQSPMPQRTFLLLPAGCDCIWSGYQPSCAKLRIPTKLVNDVAVEIGREAPARPELASVFVTRDPILESICSVLVAELKLPEHPARSLMVSSLSFALAVQLYRRYEARKPFMTQSPRGLGPQVLKRVIEYMQDNVGETIDLADLAALAGVSRFHFTASFKQTTGCTPSAYFERLRIARAQRLLIRGDLSLANVALAVGFADQSHFIRRFRHHMGMTPADYAGGIFPGVIPPGQSLGVFDQRIGQSS